MAKKKITSLGIFARTEPSPSNKPAQDLIESRGVGLKQSEWEFIEKTAAELNLTTHGLAVSLLRYGLKDYKAGKMKTKTQTTLDL